MDNANPIDIIIIGSFGAAVTRNLKRFDVHFRESVWTDETTINKISSSALLVIAAWRPFPEICEFADAFCHARGMRFLPVILGPQNLEIGPLVVPGMSACWNCWRRRSKQHDPYRKERTVIDQYYSKHLDRGPLGFLEPFALIAAACVAESSKRLTGIAGQLCQVDLFTRKVINSRVIGIDGCSRCGLNGDQEVRTYEYLKRELSYLWCADQSALHPNDQWESE